MRIHELVDRRRDRGEDSEPTEWILAAERLQHGGRDRIAADTVESVAAGDDVALELVLLSVVREPDPRALGVEVVDADVVDLEQQRESARQARGDQVLHDLRLAVDDDRAAAREVAQRDAVTLAVELKVDAV